MQGKLILETGEIFIGTIFGSIKDISAEVVFNTSMVGYPEAMTDPSYRKQILILTYPCIGNYGIPSYARDKNGILKYFESEKIHISGLIISDYCKNHSHWMSCKSLSDWMKECKDGQKNFLATRAKLAEHPVEKVGANLRAMMPWISKKKLVDSDKS